MNDAANLRVIFTPENKFEKVNLKKDKPCKSFTPLLFFSSSF
jgi:hypothetical protein